MPRIEVKTPPTGKSWGSTIQVDGRELLDVRSIDLRIALDEIPTAIVEVIATEKLSFEGEAALHVVIVAQPGFEVVAAREPDGTVRYRCEAVK